MSLTLDASDFLNKVDIVRDRVARKAVRRALTKVGRIMVKEVRRGFGKRRTGFGKRAVGSKVTVRKGRPASVRIGARTDKKLGRYKPSRVFHLIEKGTAPRRRRQRGPTGRVVAQPFIGPALRRQRATILNTMARELAGAIRQG